ncbi:MAG: AmmeMemoRadiSam system protein B [Acidobacteriota bacterium]|nr:AmmeMemoRadiSam system protein B [Acidobacteriota bacterium]
MKVKLFTVFFILLGTGLLIDSVLAQGIRRPVWAGQFYEADPARLAHLIDAYLQETNVPGIDGRIAGLICPHAGYVYSGKIAASGYQLTKGLDISTVVIIGPSHRSRFEGCSIYLKGGFETPLGVAEVDEKLAGELARISGYGYVADAHREEHSVEVQVPFIQRAFPQAKIVPIVMGYQTEDTISRLAAALVKALPGRKALVVASTDMSHFLSQEEARGQDGKTIELLKAMEIKTLLRKVERGENIMCGGGPVLSLLLYAQKLGQARLAVLKAGDSASAGGSSDRVVGYLSAAVYFEEKPASLILNKEEKAELLALARNSIEYYLTNGEFINLEISNPKFLENRGVFVTLRENGELRGCIGFVEPVYPLYQAIIQSAGYAAAGDPRFSPLKPDELKKIKVEISILTRPEPVDDISDIKIGQHGLLIKQGNRSGLLLPQVASEFGWDRSVFLKEVCRKASLPDDAWKKPGSLFKFEALVFGE